MEWYVSAFTPRRDHLIRGVSAASGGIINPFACRDSGSPMAADDTACESGTEKTAKKEKKKKKVRQWENGEWVLENNFVMAANSEEHVWAWIYTARSCDQIRERESSRIWVPSDPARAFLVFGNAFWKVDLCQCTHGPGRHVREVRHTVGTHSWIIHRIRGAHAHAFQKSLLLCPPPEKKCAWYSASPRKCFGKSMVWTDPFDKPLPRRDGFTAGCDALQKFRISFPWFRNLVLNVVSAPCVTLRQQDRQLTNNK